MELFELILLLLAAVLVSTVLDQVTPRVSLPLVQIGLGVVIAVIAGAPLQIEIDPELFLVMFIAPLLFDESRHASKRALWDNKGAIVSLAIGLVLVTVLVVGFVLHWIEPSLPLAAAFALGAALGPTDAVAVTALGKDIRLSGRQKALLSGEALINDASGVVSFQFAIAAAVTGSFSFADAASAFGISFFGGIAIGLALGLVATIVLRAIRSRGFESTTVHVVFEVFTPFVVFLAAEHLGVSGILAVVAAGLLMTLLPQKATPVSARLKIASTSVWDALVFVINGVVFVLLGMQLPKAIMPSWDSTQMDSLMLIGLVLLITFLVEGVRFIWILAMEAVSRDSETGKPVFRLSGKVAKDSLVTTLAGPKGAVTLSIVLTIPYYLVGSASLLEPFPFRDTLIFLASGTILCTLLLANFVVPLLSPKVGREEKNDDGSVSIEILENVIRELEAQQTEQSKIATQIVVRQYQERVRRLRRQNTSTACMIELRIESLDCQRSYVESSIASGEVERGEGQRYLEQIDHMEKLLLRRRSKHKTFGEVWARMRVAVMRMVRALARAFKHMRADEPEQGATRLFRIGLEQCSLDYLKEKMLDPDVEVSEGAAVLAAECEAVLSTLEAQEDADGVAEVPPVGVPPVRHRSLRPGSVDDEKLQKIKARVSDVEAEALRLELDEIQRMRESGALDRDEARDLREEVYLLQMAAGE